MSYLNQKEVKLIQHDLDQIVEKNRLSLVEGPKVASLNKMIIE